MRQFGAQDIQLLGRAQGRVHLVGVVELRVVHLVLSRLLPECYNVLEAVPPVDFGGQVAAPGLGRHSRRLYNAL